MINVDVKEEDSLKITQSNKILNCICACRKAHNGPITTIEELVSLVQDKKRHDKALHKSLNLEIRFRKLTFTYAKVTCPFFQQQKLNIDQKKEKKLENLISTQLDLQVKADMSYLETAITECSENFETEKVLDDDSLDKELQQLKEVIDNQDANVTCCPSNERFIIGLFTDGYYPGEVIKVQGEYIEADFLLHVSIAQMKKDSSLWKRP